MNPYQQVQPGYAPQQAFGNPMSMNGLPNGGYPVQGYTTNCPQVPQGYPQQTGYPNQGIQQPNHGFQNTPQYPVPPQAAGFPQAAPGFPPQPTNGFSQPTAGFSQPSVGLSQPTAGYTQPSTGFPNAAPGYPQSNLNQGYQQAQLGNIQIPKTKPTVVPAKPFNPTEDASVLRKAMKGLGTNEKAIINVLTKRTSEQRQKIAMEYQSVFGRDLIANLKSETSGRFEDLLVALMTPLPQFHAKELHDAIAGIGTDEDVLIEVMCSLSNHEIIAVKEAYNLMYKKPLETDIKGDTSGWFKKFLTTLCEAKRSEDYRVDQAKAKTDAQNLCKAGKQRLGTDESEFNEILCSRSIPQLQATFNEYALLARHDIDAAIKSEFSGNIEKALRALVRIIRNKPAYFAEQLQKSMKGLGTNDRQLIRIMATRCEVDLGDISDLFKSKYGKTLAEWIKGDCSGDYKKCLLALLGQ